MGWTNLRVLLIFEKLKFIIGSIRLQDKVGKMLVIQLSWLQLVAGCSRPVLESDEVVPYLPVGWIQNLHVHLVDTKIKVEVYGLWRPTKQREEDRILMDIAQHQIPSWAWAGIDRCRLFLGVNTLADITSIDGSYILLDAREVKDKRRRSRLHFPVQAKPDKTNIVQWQYLIDSVSTNRKLHVPLGRWIRSPDQFFQYMMNEEGMIVYKRQFRAWQVFGKRNNTTRRFDKLALLVATIPSGDIPVQGIETSNYIIVLSTYLHLQSGPRMEDVGVLKDTHLKDQVIGRFHVDTAQLENLLEQWHDKGFKLFAATDGGLKDMVGTSSYAFFFEEELTPILWGSTGEFQPNETASVTRQELCGQLGVEYWLARWTQQWGVPRGHFHVTVITDSKASIDIMQNTQNIGGIRDALTADMDMGLEIAEQQRQTPCFNREVIKVESHILEEDAPNKFYWGCNMIADSLATNARQIFSLTYVKTMPDGVLAGTMAGCKIDGSIVNNNLYDALKEHINGRELKFFFMNKYGWSHTMFDTIDWTAHHRQLKRTSFLQKVTLLKYIHGWLATKRRRHLEGVVSDTYCPLCRSEEDRLHLFNCRNQQIKEIRAQSWSRLMCKLSQSTVAGFHQVFTAGLSTVVGEVAPEEYVQRQWPRNLQDAYNAQQAIGWEQVLYGHICQCWSELLGYNRHGTEQQGPNLWASRAVSLCWRFGLDMWKVRNGLIHGTDGQISVFEQQRKKILRLPFIATGSRWRKEILIVCFPPTKL